MDRNTLLAFFLIALVLLFTPFYMELVSPLPKQQDSLAVEQEPIINEYVNTDRVETSSSLSSAKEERDLKPVKGYSEETKYTIKTDLYKAILSSKHGGSIQSFEIFDHTYKDSTYINLINDLNKDNLRIEYKNIDGQDVDLSAPWVPSKSNFGGDIGSPTTFSFSVEVGNQKTIKKSLTFYPDDYFIDLDIDLVNTTENIFSGIYSVGWYGGLSSTEKNTQDDQTYFSSFVYQGGELVDLKAKSGSAKSESFKGSAEWCAIRTKYFITVFLPESPTDVSSVSLNGSNKNNIETYDMAIHMPSSKQSSLRIYLGPLEYDRIKNAGAGLAQVMNFGFSLIRPISKGVLWLLKKMQTYIPNYGLVLILFSVMVKILVYPLTKKSYESTAAMQELAPELTSIKEKYKNNPQKVNEATMKLYKERGVNPLGGCLPMLLQMPLLLALFQVFRSTIELRAEPFVFWIKDLSAPDTIFYLPFTIPIYGSQVSVLPVIMVVSMFLQQKMMSPASAQQPQQKMMMYFMTGFFFLLFNSFPSGLNLYYTLFNILTILQQAITKKTPAAALSKP